MREAEDPPRTEERPFDLLPEAEPMSVQDIRDSLIIRERDLFLLTDPLGQVVRGNPNGHGLYHQDTRYLSGYEFSFSAARPLVLLSTAELGYSSEQVMTNPSMLDAEGRRVPRGTLQVMRTRVLEDVLEETMTVTNYNSFPVTIEMQYRFSADFADIFEVRGYEPERRGVLEAPGFFEGALVMRYLGADQRRRETLVHFDQQPETLAGDAELAIATYRVPLPPRGRFTVRLVICVDGRLEAPRGDARFAIVAGSYVQWREGTTSVVTDNDFFNAILARSLDDIRMLWTRDDGSMSFPAAGTPWYDALFGRDACISGAQLLAFKPEIAKEALASLARFQGTKVDHWRDEEPGKIPHELRRGELTNTGELPFAPYYGSIDSTPLFLFLAGEYYRWTADIKTLTELRPNLEAGLEWMRKYGDTNGDGYLDYEKRSVKGLVNQGWKDSADSMVHSNGELLRAPITLVEVQSYVHGALVRLADVFTAFGDETAAAAMRDEAAQLRKRFNRDFWIADENCFALALDGDGRAAATVTSNAGQALWGGIADPELAAQLAQRLLRRDMFSGWGIRTLSSESPSYNPQGYHVGTVWPHDNSIVAMGLKRYGHEAELNAVATALCEAARQFQYYRLPELFGGEEQSGHRKPVPYPVACRPQAWAAGTFPMVTQAILGLVPDAPAGRLYVVNPMLPAWLDRVEVTGLRVGTAEADLLYQRRGSGTWAVVKDVRGDLDVQITRQWPEGL